MNVKSITDFAKKNKDVIIDKGIVVAGGLAGIAIGLVFVNKTSSLDETTSTSDETPDETNDIINETPETD